MFTFFRIFSRICPFFWEFLLSFLDFPFFVLFSLFFCFFWDFPIFSGFLLSWNIGIPDIDFGMQGRDKAYYGWQACFVVGFISIFMAIFFGYVCILYRLILSFMGFLQNSCSAVDLERST